MESNIPYARARSISAPAQYGDASIAIRRKSLVVAKVVPKDAHEASLAAIPNFSAGSWRMLSGNKLYILLILVPVSIASEQLGTSPGIQFALSCAAILPLAGLLGEATEQVAAHTNETLSGLLNATFGNATEAIVSYFALNRGLLTVVQVSLLGSVLSNTLLVLGCACLAGGLQQAMPTFNKVAAVSNATLLQIAILGLMVPTLLEGVGALQVYGDVDLSISRGISIVLLILYVLYCYFQLFSHRHLFEETDDADDDDEEEEPVRGRM